MTEEQATTPQAEETGPAQEATKNNTEQGTQEGQEQRREERQETEEQETEGQVRAKEPQSVEELPKWARDEIKGLRKENSSRRTAQKEQQNAEATELQNVSAERDTLKEENEKLTQQVRRSRFIETISLPNARAAWGYVLDGTVEVDFDENNRPKNLDAIRNALREEDGALFGNGSADGGATGKNGSGFSGRPGVDRMAYAYENERG